MLVGWGTGISARGLLAGGAEAHRCRRARAGGDRGLGAFDLDFLRARASRSSRRRAHGASPSGAPDVRRRRLAPVQPVGRRSVGVFSREYFALVRDRLRAGGRAATWIQLYEMDAESARSLVATFLEAFPDAHAFRASPSANDVFLIGIKSRAPTSRGALARTMASRVDASARVALRLAGLDDVAALVATDIAGPEDLIRYAAGASVSTDDSASLEYRIADHVLRGTGDDARAIAAGLDWGTAGAP